jgi:hypothetical protein
VRLPREARRRTAKILGEIYTEAPASVLSLIVDVLHEYGEDAAPAASVLVEAIARDDSGSAALTLIKLGPVGIRELVLALDDERDALRAAAAHVLGQIGPRALSARSALLAVLADEPPGDAVVGAMLALCKICAAEPSAIVPPILDQVGRLPPEQREAVSAGLAEIGTAAVPALTAGLQHAGSQACWTAARALGSLGSAARVAIAGLAGAARHADPSVARAAAEALERVNPGGQPPPDRTGAGGGGAARPASWVGRSARPVARSAWPVARTAWPGRPPAEPEEPPDATTTPSPEPRSPAPVSTGPSPPAAPSVVSTGASPASSPASVPSTGGSPTVPPATPPTPASVAPPPDEGLYMEPRPSPPGLAR